MGDRADELKPLRVKVTSFPGLEHIMILINRKASIAKLKEEIQETLQRIFPYRSQAPISNIRKDKNKILIPDWYPIEPVLQDNEEVFISYDLLSTNCSQCLVMETPNPSYSGSFDSCPNQSMQIYQQGQNSNQTPKSCHGPMPVAGAFEGNNRHVYADMENIGLHPLDVSINSLVNRIMQNEEKEVNKDNRESDESDSILKRQKVFENRIVNDVDQVADEDQTIIEDTKQKNSMWAERKELSENEIRDSVDCELKKSEVAAESVTGILIEDGGKRKKRRRRKHNAKKNDDSFETLLTDDTMTDLKESGIGSDSTVNVLTKKNLQVMEDAGINLKEPENKDKLESHVNEDKEKIPLATKVKEDIPQVSRDTTRAHKVVKDAREPEESFLSDIGDASQQECTSSQKSKRRKSKKRHKDQENDAKSTSSKYKEEETQLSKSKKKKQILTELDDETMQESDEGKAKEGFKSDSGSFPVTNKEVEMQSLRSKKESHMYSDSTPLSVKETGLALENGNAACSKDKLASAKLDEVETKSSKSQKKRHKNADSDWEAMAETSSALESKEVGSMVEKEERCMKDTPSVLTKHDRVDTQSTKSKKKRHKDTDSDWEAMAEMSSALENKEEEERCKSESKSVTANLTEIETQSMKSKKKRHRNADSMCESTEKAEIAPEDKDDSYFKAPTAKKSKSRHKAMLQENHDSSQNEKTKTTKQKSKHKGKSLDFDYLLEDSKKEIDNGVNISKKEQPSFDYETDKEIKGIQSKILTVVSEIVTESDFSATNEPLKFTKDVLRLKNDVTCTIDSNSKKEVCNSKTEPRDKDEDRASTIIAIQDQIKSDNAKKHESSKDRKENERSKKKRKGNRELLGASHSSTSSISFSDYKGVVVSKQTGTKSKKEKSVSRHSSKKSKKERKRRKSSSVSNTEKSVAKVHDWLSKLNVEHIPLVEEYQETISTVINETKIESKERSFSVLESAVAVETIPDDSSKESGNDLKGHDKGDDVMGSERARGKDSTGKDTGEGDAGGVEGDQCQIKEQIISPAKLGKESSETVISKQEEMEDTSYEKKGTDGLKKKLKSENIGKGEITSKALKRRQSIKEVDSNEKTGDDGARMNVGREIVEKDEGKSPRKSLKNETFEKNERKSPKKNVEREGVEKDKGKSPKMKSGKEIVEKDKGKSPRKNFEKEVIEKDRGKSPRKNAAKQTVEKDKGKSHGSKQQISSGAVRIKHVADKKATMEKNEKDRKEKNVEKEGGKGRSAEKKEHAGEDVDPNDSFDEAVTDLKFESLVEDGASLISSKVKQPLKKLSTAPTYVQKSLNGFLSSAQQKRFESKKKAVMKPTSTK